MRLLLTIYHSKFTITKMTLEQPVDNPTIVKLTVQAGSTRSLFFDLEVGSSWNPTGRIVVSKNYHSAPLATYTVGAGVTILAQRLTWRLPMADINNEDAIFDFCFQNIADNQRDFRGKIIVNNSLL